MSKIRLNNERAPIELIREAVAGILPGIAPTRAGLSLDFSAPMNSQYFLLLGLVGALGEGLSLDFSAARNSQYLPLLALLGGQAF